MNTLRMAVNLYILMWPIEDRLDNLGENEGMSLWSNNLEKAYSMNFRKHGIRIK